MVTPPSSPSPLPPGRTLRRSPPRRALHERSESDTNTVATPSIRLVEDSLVYATAPFPTQPSQVLSPTGARFNDGTIFVSSEDSTVSSQQHPSSTSLFSPKATVNFPKPSDGTSYTPALTNSSRWTKRPVHSSALDPRVNASPTNSPPPAFRPVPPAQINASAATGAVMTSREGRDASRYDPLHHGRRLAPTSGHPTASPITRQTIRTPSPVSPASPAGSASSRWRDGRAVDRERLLSERVGASPASAVDADRNPSNNTAPSAQPTWLSQDPEPALEGQRKRSVVSVVSSASSETLGGPSQSSRSRRPSASYSAFPPPTTQTPPPRRTPSAKKTKESSTSASSASAKTSGSSRSGSPPSDVQAVPAIRPGPRLQYPVVRGPSAQGAYADAAISIPKRSSRRMTEESRPSGSRSYSREPSTGAGESERRSESFALDRNSGLNSHPVSSKGSDPLSPAVERIEAERVEAPQPALTRPSRDKGKGRATIRTVDERGESQDAVDNLQRRSQRASLLATASRSNRNSRGDLADRPSSRASFMAVGVPNWAKSYYARGGRDSFLGDANAAREILESNSRRKTVPAGGYVSPVPPAKRRPQRITLPSRGSLEIMSAPRTAEFLVRDAPRKRTTEIWSPRLQHDRRATTYSVWEPPQLQGKMDQSFFTRRGLQVVMFCCGFIFAPAWIIGALLPLPYNPQSVLEANEKGEAVTRADIEKALDRDVGAIDEIHYENARWWRNVNRMMSLVGLLIIGAIIALVVVAIRMQSPTNTR